MNTSAGHTFDTPLLGLTLPEHGLGNKAVHFPSSHYLTIASTGAGKLLTSAAHQLIGWPHDMIVITPKEDLCNFALGRRSDPSLFADPRVVMQQGGKLGVNASSVTQTRYHLPQGRVMNVDLGGSTAYGYSRYTFLSDIDINQPGAMARLMAISRGIFPDQKSNASGDPYWQLAPQGAFAAVCGFLLATESNPRNCNLVRAAQLLLGVDPATGKSNPQNQERLFKQMMHVPHLGGFIAAQGAELFNIGERTLGPLMSTIGTRTRWLLSDSRIKDILSGPSDFSLNEVGDNNGPLSIFVTPSRGDKSTDAFLRMFLELSVLMFQQRNWTPERPVLLIADEVPAWGEEQVNTLRRALNVLRDKKIKCWLYAQSYSQLLDLVGEQGAAEILSASTVQVFGVRDHSTAQMIRDRLGKTTIRRRGSYGPEEVYVADTDAIYDELSPASSLQYVIPYSARPVRLKRAGFLNICTAENLSVPGLEYDGHYDTGL